MIFNNITNRSLFRLKIFLLAFLIFSPVLARAEAPRLVSLKPNITEILFDLGLGSQVVGVTSFCDYPESVKNIPKVADYLKVNVERVLMLKPTLVVASEENSQKKDVEFLRDRGIEVLVIDFSRLEDVYRGIRTLGEKLQVSDRADALVGKIKKELGDLQLDGPHKKVLAVVGTKPLVVVGGENMLNDLFQSLGLENVAGKSHIRYPNISREQLIMYQPDVIFDLAMGSEKSDAANLKQELKSIQNMPAMKTGSVYILNVEDFHPSARFLVGAKKIISMMKK